MKVFVFEHLSGGIGSDQAAMQPLHLLCQGGAMLRAAADDVLAIGAEVVTMLNASAQVESTGLHVVPVDRHIDPKRTFDQLACYGDAVLVIAPECDGSLIGWLRRLADTGAASLCCSPAAAELCADKLATSRHLIEAGIPTPEARLFCTTNLAQVMLDPEAAVSWSTKALRFDADGASSGD